MIRVLAADVVDRIAAGEVLDRPANLVKEVVENSLDAGSDQIDIEFDDGGRRVCIVDNGHGIEKQDLAVALQRHATSKIQNSEDLFNLHSFGFRGEALASIAAVSRLTLTSRPAQESQAFRVLSDFGAVQAGQPVSAPIGTEIRALDLFENVPARLKFLKSETAESTQIKNTLKALALANPQVGFTVRSRGQLLYHWPKKQTFADRAQTVLENADLHYGAHEHNGFKVEVLVSSPLKTANVNRNLWFFVQDRWIQDRSLSASVMEAYRNLLMHGEYPTVVAKINLPADEVDVNVHPTKAQIKFRDPQNAFRALHRAIRDVLEKAPWMKDVPVTPQVASSHMAPHYERQEDGNGQGEERVPLRFQGLEFERTQYSTKTFPEAAAIRAPQNEVPQNFTVAPQNATAAPQNYSTAAADYKSPASASRAEAPVEFRWASLQVIGQINHTYIAAQTQESFYMVDQHAAHERVAFERLMESFHAGKIEVQHLLLPLTLDFSQEEVEALVFQAEQIEKVGISLERLAPETIAVQAIPTLVNEGAVSEALHKLAFEITTHQGELALEKSVAEIFASMACHSVVRAGQSLSFEEMKSLLLQMDQFPLSSFCPHGRPVFVRRRFSEIEREFGRIV